MVGTKTTGDETLFRHAVTAAVRATVFTSSYLEGEETGAGAMSNCFWIAVGPVEDFT